MNDNYVLLTDQQRFQMMSQMYLYISNEFYKWIISPYHGLDKLLDELREQIKLTTEAMGNTMPGGKKIGSIDRELILGASAIQALKMLDEAKLKGERSAKELAATNATNKKEEGE
jgi:hypothetical protein